MPGAKMFCDRPGMIGLIETINLEADRETVDRLSSSRLHQCGDQRRINTPRKKYSQGDIAQHLRFDYVLEHLLGLGNEVNAALRFCALNCSCFCNSLQGPI